MYNSLRGIITEKNIDSLCILCGGIEYIVEVPGMDLGRLPNIGEEGRVFTWLYHKEDQMKLYGFAEEAGRHTFLELLKVEGIGPRAALKIMGGISRDDLEKALETDDLSRLEAVPGLGKKTAQKMLLALKGKLVRSASEAETPYKELLDALAGMGYERRAAADALAAAEKELPPGTGEAEKEKLLFRQAIVRLSESG
ncbi:MAG: Holliday junction branch migration protein RuvA [Treponema sp.]|nr:Holliday junction branch migration protein RuvA [Treponema sp.]